MPRVHLPLVAILVLAVLSAAADAKPRRKRKVAASAKVVRPLDERVTTTPVTVRKRPGERQAAAGKLAAGTEVVVEAEQGRWLRVRAGRITGYVTRTTLSAPRATPNAVTVEAASNDESAVAPVSEPETSRPTSWRTARDRAVTSSALLATVTVASATVRSAPDASSDEVASIAEGQHVVVMDARKTPGWIQVRDTEGHTGWIAQGEVGNDKALVETAVGEAPVASVSASASTRVVSDDRQRRWALRVAAGAGYRARDTQIAATGAEQELVANASVARLEVDAAAYPLRSIAIGVDAHLDVGSAMTRGLSAGVRVGLRSRELAELSVRAGTRRESVDAEQLAGSTVGVRLDVTPARSRISARIEIDSLVAGSWQQAAMQSSPRALWAGLTIGVRISGVLSLHAAFELGRASTASPEMTRIDASQLLQVGLSGAL